MHGMFSRVSFLSCFILTRHIPLTPRAWLLEFRVLDAGDSVLNSLIYGRIKPVFILYSRGEVMTMLLGQPDLLRRFFAILFPRSSPASEGS